MRSTPAQPVGRLQPISCPIRPIRMKSTFIAAGAAAFLVLVGCGTESDPEAASDPTPTSSSTPIPTAEPTVGTYPSYEPEDYSYTLGVSCFCADAGAPIRVTVVDGEVTNAIYTGDGRGTKEGDRADDFRWITINDVIDAANDTEAASVKVKWPDGQDYPSSVYVDQDELMVDEEVGYEITDVAPR